MMTIKFVVDVRVTCVAACIYWLRLNSYNKYGKLLLIT